MGESCGMKEYHYTGCCVGADEDEINTMKDQNIEITWHTFLLHVPIEEVKFLFPKYSYRQGVYIPDTAKRTMGFHIKDDRAVSFHRSRYRGERCYYIYHSAIEYIWIKGVEQPEGVRGERTIPQIIASHL